MLNDELILNLSELPLAKQSPSIALREEIVRLELEGATPSLLSANVHSNADAASFFVDLFKDEDLAQIAEECDELLPRPAYRVGPIELERIHRFLERHEASRQRARDWASGSSGPFAVELRKGWFADTTFIDAVATCAKLEMLLAVEQLAGGDQNAAADAWESAMTLCELLAATPLVTARLTAVPLRSDLLQLLGAIVQAKKADRPLAQRLLAKLEQTVSAWPSEAGLWRADRAIGLHTYEIIRAGHLLAILTPEEVTRFSEEQILLELENAARRSVDADQLFYLESMRKVITACQPTAPQEPPYYGRAQVIRDVLKKLEAKRQDSDFPLIAGRLLLPEVQPTQQLLAIDRARCEVWRLALARATGVYDAVEAVSPVTGKPILVQVEENRVVIRDFVGVDLEAEPPVIVPRFDVRLSRLP